jgi:hypothetical protein
MFPLRIQARDGSPVGQRYFSTIVAFIAAQHAGDEGRTDDELTLAISGEER